MSRRLQCVSLFQRFVFCLGLLHLFVPTAKAYHPSFAHLSFHKLASMYWPAQRHFVYVGDAGSHHVTLTKLKWYRQWLHMVSQPSAKVGCGLQTYCQAVQFKARPPMRDGCLLPMVCYWVKEWLGSVSDMTDRQTDSCSLSDTVRLGHQERHAPTTLES